MSDRIGPEYPTVKTAGIEDSVEHVFTLYLRFFSLRETTFFIVTYLMSGTKIIMLSDV